MPDQQPDDDDQQNGKNDEQGNDAMDIRHIQIKLGIAAVDIGFQQRLDQKRARSPSDHPLDRRHPQ